MDMTPVNNKSDGLRLRQEIGGRAFGRRKDSGAVAEPAPCPWRHGVGCSPIGGWEKERKMLVLEYSLSPFPIVVWS